MKDIVFVVESYDLLSVYIKGKHHEVKKDDIEAFLNKNAPKVRSVHILISDRYVFSLHDHFAVKSKKDALNAAKYKLETLFHTNKIKNYFSHITIKKSDRGYTALIYYTESNFSDLLDPVITFFQKKIKDIRPVFDIFISSDYDGYKYREDYVTFFGEDGGVSTFPMEKCNLELSEYNILEALSLEPYLHEIGKSDPLVNFKKDGSIFSITKIFAPALIFLLVINVAFIGYLWYRYPKAKSIYEKQKAVNLKKMKQLEPLNELKDKKSALQEKINIYNRFLSMENNVANLIRDLASDMPEIWLESFRYESGKLSMRISNVKSQELIKYLKSKKYVKNVNIRGRVSVVNDKERFNLEVNLAE